MAKNKRRKLMFILNAMFLLLGLTLGGSLTTFFLFLNSHIDALIIFSYLCLLTFIIILIFETIILFKYRPLLFNKEINNNDEKQN